MLKTGAVDVLFSPAALAIYLYYKPESLLVHVKKLVERMKRNEEILQTELYATGCLSVRAINCLESEGIINIGRLITNDPDDLLEVRNLGETTLNEIVQFLGKLGLRLKMSPDAIVRWLVTTEDVQFPET